MKTIDRHIKYYLTNTLFVLLCLIFISNNILSQALSEQAKLDFKKVDDFIESQKFEDCFSYMTKTVLDHKEEFSNIDKAKISFVKCKCKYAIDVSTSKSICDDAKERANSLNLSNAEELQLYAEMQILFATMEIENEAVKDGRNRLEKLLLKVNHQKKLTVLTLISLSKADELLFNYHKGLKNLNIADSIWNILGVEDYTIQHELYNSYAGVHSRLDNHEETKRYADKNLALVKSQNSINYYHLGNVNNTLARYHFRTSDVSKALYYFEKEFEFKSRVVDESRLSHNMINIANMASKVGQYDKAESYAKRSLEISKKLYGLESNSVAHNNFVMGLIYLEQNKYDKALQYFMEATDLELKLFGGNNKGIYFNYIRLADSYFGLNNYDQAIYYSQKAIEGFKAYFGEKNQQVSWGYERLTESAIRGKKYKLARECMRKAYTSLDVDLTQANLEFESIRLPFLVMHILRLDLELSLIELKSNQTQEKLEYINLLESISYGLYNHLKLNMGEGTMHRLLSIRLSGLTDYILLKNSFLFENSNDPKYLDEMLKAMEKGRNNILTETKIADQLVEYAGVPNTLLKKQIDIKDSIASLTLKLSTIDPKLQKEKYYSVQNKINAFKEDKIQLIETLKKDHEEFYAFKYDYPVVTISDIQKACVSKENWLLYASTYDGIYLLSITKEDVNYHKIPLDNSLRDDINQVRKSILSKKPNSSFYQAANNVYKSLLAFDEIEKGNHLKIFAGGALSGLPFEILCTDISNTSSTLALNDYLISYHHSPYLTMNPHKGKESTKGALVMAPEFEGTENVQLYAALDMDNETLRGSLKKLKGAQEEVNNIAKFTDANLLYGNNCSEKTFKEIAHKYDVLHLATHGFVDHANPNYSKLILSEENNKEDGFLHSYEIYGLELNADLVTLSACNTGTGEEEEGEGVSSLGRAFAFAGCPNSVMSLWSVNDQSTAKLMTYFYDNLMKGIPKAEALRNAKLEFLEKQPAAFSAPFYWAGFVYYGDNLPLRIGNENHFLGSSIWSTSLLIGLLIILFILLRKFRLKSN